MPNASGYPTLQEVQKWTQEQKIQSDYEYIMPHHAEKVQADFKRLATLECMQTCAYANAKLDKKEIEVKAQLACERAKNQTKAVCFTNHYDEFEKVAKNTYAEYYQACQDVFSSKYHLFRDTKHDLERYGEDSALRRVAGEIEQVIRFKRK